MKLYKITIPAMLIGVLFYMPVHALYKGAPKCQAATQVTTAAGENIDWDELEPIADLATGRTLAPAQKRRRLETPQEQSEAKHKKAAQDAEFKKFERVPEPLRAKIHEYAINPWPYWEAWLDQSYYFSPDNASIQKFMIFSPTLIGLLLDNHKFLIIDSTTFGDFKIKSTIENVNSSQVYKLSPTRFAYVNDKSRHVEIYDLTFPDKPHRLTSFHDPKHERLTPISATQIACWSTYAHTVNIWDFSNPQAPAVVRSFSIKGIHIFDLQPLTPTLLGINNRGQLELWDISTLQKTGALQLPATAKLGGHILIPLTPTLFATRDNVDNIFAFWDTSAITKESTSVKILIPLHNYQATSGIKSSALLSPHIFAYSASNDTVVLLDITHLQDIKPLTEISIDHDGYGLTALDKLSFAYTTKDIFYIRKPNHEALNAFFKLSVNDRERLEHLIRNLRTVQEKRKKSGAQGPMRLKEVGLTTFKRMPSAIQTMLKLNFDLA